MKQLTPFQSAVYGLGAILILVGLILWPTGSMIAIYVYCIGAVMFAAMFLATAVLYILGTAWFMVQTKMTLAASLAACVIPFLPGDLIKIIAVMLVAPPIEAALKRAVPASQSAA